MYRIYYRIKCCTVCLLPSHYVTVSMEAIFTCVTCKRYRTAHGARGPKLDKTCDQLQMQSTVWIMTMTSRLFKQATRKLAYSEH